jgi:retron-type reverse transcriptase
VNWVLEADIVSFFDRIDRKRLKELLQERLADKSLMRLTRIDHQAEGRERDFLAPDRCSPSEFKQIRRLLTAGEERSGANRV